MKYMLDTNICIYLIKQSAEKLLKKLASMTIGDVCISSITYTELMFGVEKSLHRSKNKSALEQFVIPLEILAFDSKAASRYGQVRAFLEAKGTPIGPLDLMIAAHALSLNSILVTNNQKEFERVPDLKVENWL